MSKKLWRKNFEIQRIHPLLAYDALQVFYTHSDALFHRKIFSEIFWVNSGLDNTGTYFDVGELRRAVTLTLKKIITEPEAVKKNHQQAKQYNVRYFKLAAETLKIDLKNLRAAALNTLYQKHFQSIIHSHGHAIYTTWFVDSDGEDFSNYLLELLRKKISRFDAAVELADAFSQLTTPIRTSNAQIEEAESLKVVQLIARDPAAYRLFQSANAEKIKATWRQLKPSIRVAINRHFERWHWMPYTYLGPAYDIDYYLEVWSGLIRQQVNVASAIAAAKKDSGEVERKKAFLIKRLHLNRDEKIIFDIASDIVWLKAFRKDVLFHGFYVIEKIYIEIAKRLEISVTQAHHLTPKEIAQVLRNGSVDVAELNRRIKGFVAVMNSAGLHVLTGTTAKKYLAVKKLEKTKIHFANELRGTPACSGTADGKVKIVNVPEEMEKMELGDIMISHTTFPALVPAMKKAAAIVTEDGGLTCHAAIVARELKKPCVVGVKNCTQVFHDGDHVHVDAHNGVITRI